MIVQLLCSITAYTRYMFIKWWFSFRVGFSIYSLHVHQMIVQLLWSLTAYTLYTFIKWWFSFCVALQHILVTCSSIDGSAFVKHYWHQFPKLAFPRKIPISIFLKPIPISCLTLFLFTDVSYFFGCMHNILVCPVWCMSTWRPNSVSVLRIS